MIAQFTRRVLFAFCKTPKTPQTASKPTKQQTGKSTKTQKTEQSDKQLENIQQLLQKHRKYLTADALKEINAYIESKNLDRVNLWRMHTVLRFISNAARIQIYLYFLACAGFLTYGFLYKYKKGDPVRDTKILITTPVVMLSMGASIWVARRLTKMMLKQIDYLPKEKKIAVQFYDGWCRTYEMQINPNQIRPLKMTSRFQSCNYEVELPGEKRKVTTQVLGDWTSRRYFQHLAGIEV